MFPNTRREFLQQSGMGVGALALQWMLAQETALAKPPVLKQQPHNDLHPRSPHFTPRAQAMISLFQHGGPSHMDLTDPKPELTKYAGTEYTGDIHFSFVNQASKKLLGSPFKFQPHGQCGMELSELLPHTADVVDELCLIRSMHTGANGHEVSIRYFHGGIPAVLGRPTLGSWLTYALGSETQDLPAFMVLADPGGHPVDGVSNWTNGFMPSMFQGTVLRPQEPRIFNLQPPTHLAGEFQRQNLALLQTLNQQHLEQHPGETDLEARIASYELAARMQTAAGDALDISQETAATHRMYGLDRPETREYGTRCLLARRLVERGVRFVQLFHNGQPWDNHSNIKSGLASICQKTDQPVAALIKDLRQRGLLDSTLVHWGGEIGRLPVTQGDGNPETAGRDHNGQGFSIWMAGGGIRGGTIHGKTDEFGHRAIEDIVTPNDFQATVMHLFGLDHERVLFPHRNQQEIMTAHRPAQVVQAIVD
ncbi:hypothetical protein Q31a_59370 [Aureliella helgolandensis]|uniref:Sulfatase n=2 Tax=Aureliella helgolandensis TaxID=2527968 RepID=A0A518GG73_9BACT|nr:hypothetical protein Q31a_59370 [Aureliella helgolandensis]